MCSAGRPAAMEARWKARMSSLGPGMNDAYENESRLILSIKLGINVGTKLKVFDNTRLVLKLLHYCEAPPPPSPKLHHPLLA